MKAGRTVIVFIDEIDGFVTHRDQAHEASRRACSQLFQEMDGLQENRGIILLGATNRYEALDPAMVRPGRFDRKIHLPLPDKAARQAIFQVHLRRRPVAQEVDLEALARHTEGMSGAEIANVCYKASYLAIRRYAREAGIPIVEIQGAHLNAVQITQEDLLAAIDGVRRERRPS